jgi:hypothetical protein
MAAATVTGAQRPHVFGDRKYRGANSIAFAANGDTWTVPGLKKIQAILLTPTTNTAFGFTVSANTITLVSGGALTFLGGVIGI